jgi:hypothetical protein
VAQRDGAVCQEKSITMTDQTRNHRGERENDWTTHATQSSRLSGADMSGDGVGGDPGPRSVVQPVQSTPDSLRANAANAGGPDSDLAGPEESYPINSPADLAGAWAAAASAHDPELARRRIIRIALDRNWADGLPADARTYIGDDAWRDEVADNRSGDESLAMESDLTPETNRRAEGTPDMTADGTGGPDFDGPDLDGPDEARTRTRGIGLGTGNPY